MVSMCTPVEFAWRARWDRYSTKAVLLASSPNCLIFPPKSTRLSCVHVTLSKTDGWKDTTQTLEPSTIPETSFRIPTGSLKLQEHLYVLQASICAKSLQLSLTLQPLGLYNPPGPSLQGILWARMLDCVDMPSSRRCYWPRDQTHISYISCLVRRVLYH